MQWPLVKDSIKAAYRDPRKLSRKSMFALAAVIILALLAITLLSESASASGNKNAWRKWREADDDTAGFAALTDEGVGAGVRARAATNATRAPKKVSNRLARDRAMRAVNAAGAAATRQSHAKWNYVAFRNKTGSTGLRADEWEVKVANPCSLLSLTKTTGDIGLDVARDMVSAKGGERYKQLQRVARLIPIKVDNSKPVLRHMSKLEAALLPNSALVNATGISRSYFHTETGDSVTERALTSVVALDVSKQSAHALNVRYTVLSWRGRSSFRGSPKLSLMLVETANPQGWYTHSTRGLNRRITDAATPFPDRVAFSGSGYGVWLRRQKGCIDGTIKQIGNGMLQIDSLCPIMHIVFFATSTGLADAFNVHAELVEGRAQLETKSCDAISGAVSRQLAAKAEPAIENSWKRVFRSAATGNLYHMLRRNDYDYTSMNRELHWLSELTTIEDAPVPEFVGSCCNAHHRVGGGLSGPLWVTRIKGMGTTWYRPKCSEHQRLTAITKFITWLREGFSGGRLYFASLSEMRGHDKHEVAYNDEVIWINCELYLHGFTNLRLYAGRNANAKTEANYRDSSDLFDAQQGDGDTAASSPTATTKAPAAAAATPRSNAAATKRTTTSGGRVVGGNLAGRGRRMLAKKKGGSVFVAPILPDGEDSSSSSSSSMDGNDVADGEELLTAEVAESYKTDDTASGSETDGDEAASMEESLLNSDIEGGSWLNGADTFNVAAADVSSDELSHLSSGNDTASDMAAPSPKRSARPVRREKADACRLPVNCMCGTCTHKGGMTAMEPLPCSDREESRYASERSYRALALLLRHPEQFHQALQVLHGKILHKAPAPPPPHRKVDREADAERRAASSAVGQALEAMSKREGNENEDDSEEEEGAEKGEHEDDSGNEEEQDEQEEEQHEEEPEEGSGKKDSSSSSSSSSHEASDLDMPDDIVQ